MGKQDRKHVTWDFRSGLFKAIRQIEMGIVDTGNVNALSATFDYLTFIYQHSDAHQDPATFGPCRDFLGLHKSGLLTQHKCATCQLLLLRTGRKSHLSSHL